MIYFLTCYKKPQLPPGELNAVHELRKSGQPVEIVNWDEWNPEELTSNDLVFLRSTWNYDQKPEEFYRFLIKLQQSEATVFNHTETLLWNLNKKYMFDFQDKGLPVIPTYLPSQKQELIHDFPETQTIIAKPFFSAGARGLQKLTREDWLCNSLPETYICQPFVASVPEKGEWSLLYFDGEFSHTVLKVPKSEDFRVQSDYGGTVQFVDVPSEWKTLGNQFLAACPKPPFFARVDLVLWKENPVLIELEVIEPELFVNEKKANENYIDAILKKANLKNG